MRGTAGLTVRQIGRWPAKTSGNCPSSGAVCAVRILPGAPGTMRHRGILTRHPARSPGPGVAPDRSGAPLGAGSRSAGSSTTARGRAAVALSRRVGARCGNAETDPAGIRRRPPPARQTARSTDAPPVRCGPTAPCPAQGVPSRTPAWPRDRPTGRSTGSVTAHPPTCAVLLLKPPYREGRQTRPPCEGVNQTERMRHAPSGETIRTTESAPCNCRPSAHGRDTTGTPGAVGLRAEG